MPAKIGSVVIDCDDPVPLASFWAEALGYQLPEGGGPFIWLTDPEGQGIRMAIQKADTPKTGKNRVHFDLYAEDLDAELARLQALGASVLRSHNMQGFRWSILQDPAGNEFCVAQGH